MDPDQKHKETLTFEDLSYMADQWICDLGYCEDIFKNQSHQSDCLQDKIILNSSGLQELNNKMNYLRCLQSDVDQIIDRIRQYENFMEMSVENLEKKAQAIENKTVTDKYRAELYETAAEINTTLKNFEQICDDYLIKLKDKFKCSLDQPIEAIAQLMMTQLDILEQVEVKTQQLQNMADVNDLKSQLVLKKHKLKENKMF